LDTILTIIQNDFLSVKFGPVSLKGGLVNTLYPINDSTNDGKASDQLQHLPRWAKNGELWSTNKKVIGSQVDPPKINTTRAV